jgi:hypothetical protein
MVPKDSGIGTLRPREVSVCFEAFTDPSCPKEEYIKDGSKDIRVRALRYWAESDTRTRKTADTRGSLFRPDAI